MEIRYKHKKLHKVCSSTKEIDREFGPKIGRKIRQRLTELEAVETLEEMRRLPGARCHELKGERIGQLAVDIFHPYCLIFEPDHDPVPQKSDGGLDWARVAAIRVVEIKDYH